MATLPLQFGDVVRALEICLWIREKCLKPSKGSDQRYNDFLNEVSRLESALQELKPALAHAFAEIEDVGPYLSGDSGLMVDDQDTLSVPGAGEIIGDFKSTLEECAKLLRKHVRFQNDRATAILNGFWHLEVQSQVDELQRRLQAHIGNTSLVVAMANLRLLSSLKEEMRRLTNSGSSRSPLDLPPVMVLLAPRFQAAIFKSPPKPFADIQGIPVQDTIKIICFHLRKITEETPEETSTDIERCLGLIKTHWLLTVLKSSQAFPNCSRRYQRVVEEIEDRIELAYSNQLYMATMDNQLAKMPDNMFQIWPEKTIPPIVLPIHPSENEEAVGSVSLVPKPQYGQQKLHIIRLSDHGLRLASEDYPHRPLTTARALYPCSPFHSLHDGLVPIYAITPFNSDKLYCLQVTNNRGGQAMTYEVQNIRDAAILQNACINYNIWSFEFDVELTTALSATFRPVLRKGFGVVQLLEHPLSTQRRRELTEAPNGSPSIDDDAQSRFSIASRSRHSSVFNSFSPSILSLEGNEDMEVFTVHKPLPPFLVLFVHEKPDKNVQIEVYTMYKTDISNLRISEEALQHKPYRLTVRHKSKSNIQVERLSVCSGQLLHFNLCALMYAEHETRNRKGNPTVETISCQWLALDFKDQQSSDRFVRRFEILQKVRNDQTCQRRSALRQARNTPITRIRTTQRRDSGSSEAPQLKPLSFSDCSLGSSCHLPPDGNT